MKKFLKTYWKTLVFFAVIGLAGGYFYGIYMLDSYPPELRQQVLDSGVTAQILGLITALQSAGYGIVLGGFGILLAKSAGLWKDERAITAKPLGVSIAVSVFGGLVMILSDILLFGRYSDAIMESYVSKPSVSFIIASVTYGAVIEEVMLRLFAMSLVALILQRTLFRKTEQDPKAAIAANIISALLFALGHLPSTFILLGSSPHIIARCLILNGGIGLLFGRLYRKYGLRYAMLAHGGCHIVSKFIWILFL